MPIKSYHDTSVPTYDNLSSYLHLWNYASFPASSVRNNDAFLSKIIDNYVKQIIKIFHYYSLFLSWIYGLEKWSVNAIEILNLETHFWDSYAITSNIKAKLSSCHVANVTDFLRHGICAKVEGWLSMSVFNICTKGSFLNIRSYRTTPDLPQTFPAVTSAFIQPQVQYSSKIIMPFKKQMQIEPEQKWMVWGEMLEMAVSWESDHLSSCPGSSAYKLFHFAQLVLSEPVSHPFVVSIKAVYLIGHLNRPHKLCKHL